MELAKIFLVVQAVAESQPKLEIEVFLEDELVVNITKHDLVPKHQPLTNEEKKQLLERDEEEEEDNHGGRERESC